MSWLSEPPPPPEAPGYGAPTYHGQRVGVFVDAVNGPVASPRKGSWLIRTGAIGVVLGTWGVVLGIYRLLAGTRVVGWVLGSSTLFPVGSVATLILGAVLAFVGGILLIVALVTSPKKALPAILLITSFIVFLVGATISAGAGKTALVNRTATDTRAVITQVQDGGLDVIKGRAQRAVGLLGTLGVPVSDLQELLAVESPDVGGDRT